jgi:hypothetical protein
VSEQPLRLPDAGTTREWTFIGGKVFVWTGGLPAVLGRPPVPAEPIVAIMRTDSYDHLEITAHQARALMEILPAVIAKAEEDHP